MIKAVTIGMTFDFRALAKGDHGGFEKSRPRDELIVALPGRTDERGVDCLAISVPDFWSRSADRRWLPSGKAIMRLRGEMPTLSAPGP